MTLQTEVPGLFDLHKFMFRGMSTMATQAGAFLERRMPLPVFRFFDQSCMTGQTEFSFVCGFDKKGFFGPLMGVMTPAALPGGKRPVQAEAGELLIDLRMTSDTDLAITLDEQPFFFGFVGGMTGRAFILCGGRMSALSSTILFAAVALRAQIGRFRLEAGIFTHAVSGMAGQAIALFHGVMHTLRLAFLSGHVAFQTQCFSRHSQHGCFLTGMDAMALRALALPHRLMLPGKRCLILFMALDTERICFLSGLDKIRPGSIMTAFALTGNYRLMHHRLQQAFLVAGMRVMAT